MAMMLAGVLFAAIIGSVTAFPTDDYPFYMSKALRSLLSRDEAFLHTRMSGQDLRLVSGATQRGKSQLAQPNSDIELRNHIPTHPYARREQSVCAFRSA